MGEKRNRDDAKETPPLPRTDMGIVEAGAVLTGCFAANYAADGDTTASAGGAGSTIEKYIIFRLLQGPTVSPAVREAAKANCSAFGAVDASSDALEVANAYIGALEACNSYSAAGEPVNVSSAAREAADAFTAAHEAAIRFSAALEAANASNASGFLNEVSAAREAARVFSAALKTAKASSTDANVDVNLPPPNVDE